MPEEDLQRLRSEYTERARRLAGRDLYTFYNPVNLFIIQQRERAVLSMLHRHGFSNQEGKFILEMGCGGGGVLIDYIRYGAKSHQVAGIDLLYSRLVEAKNRFPVLMVANADGQHLPFPCHFFDLILQYTAFSSVLDPVIKSNIAIDLLRTLKPGGMILWYDFWLNPTNPQTRGIRPAEIRTLFPGCTFDFKKITLAPPLARKVVPFSWGLALFLESFKIFNSHYLVAIQPENRQE